MGPAAPAIPQPTAVHSRLALHLLAAHLSAAFPPHQAEAVFAELKQHPDACAQQLVRTLRTSPSLEARALCAVLLRKVSFGERASVKLHVEAAASGESTCSRGGAGLLPGRCAVQACWLCACWRPAAFLCTSAWILGAGAFELFASVSCAGADT